MKPGIQGYLSRRVCESLNKISFICWKLSTDKKGKNEAYSYVRNSLDRADVRPLLCRGSPGPRLGTTPEAAL